MHNQPLKIYISAGELSGDLHAAKLAESLYKKIPNVEIKAMGGPALKAVGVEIALDCRKYANLHGFNLPKLIFKSTGTLFKVYRLLRSWRPDQVVLVDYADFNMILSKVCSLLGIPCTYLIPPSVWTWREGRLKSIKKRIKACALIYPFEEKFYHKNGYTKAQYVGHPLVDDYQAGKFQKDYHKTLAKDLGLSSDRPILAVLPGSRLSEIRRMLPIIFSALQKLKEQQPDLQSIISIAPSIDEQLISRLLKPLAMQPWIKLSKAPAVEIMKTSDIALLKSGTCNLEAAFIGIPFITTYRVSKLEAYIIRAFVNVSQYSPVNIIKKNSVTELMQERATANEICDHLSILFSNKEAFQEAKQKLAAVVEELVEIPASQSDLAENKLTGTSFGERTSEIVLKNLKVPSTSLYRRIFTYLKPYKSQYILALICMTIFGASDGAVPFIIKYILDGVFTAKEPQLLWVLLVALMVFALVRAICDFGQQFLTSKISHLIVQDIRNEMHQKILQLSSRFFIRNSSGDLLARQTNDVLQIGSLLTNSFTSLIRDSIRCVTLLVAAFVLDPRLALIAVIGIPLGFYPVYRFNKRLRRLGRTSQAAVGSITGKLQETISGLKVIQIFARTEHEQLRFETGNNELKKALIKSEKIRALTGPVNEVIAAIAICAVMTYGALSVMDNVRTQGDFIAFLMAVFLMYDPFKKLSRLSGNMQQGLASAERVFEILDLKPEIYTPENPKPLGSSNEIIFKNVWVTYERDKRPALKDINLTIQQGQKIALVGPSGSGKSTLVDLVARFIDPDRGEVFIGGVNVKEAELGEVRSRTAMVSQHTFLFDDTIFNNIAYGNSQTTEAEVLEAAKAANAYDFIMNLPQKFSTIIGDSGLSLSGGERQRIAIARALLKNSPILILDEATASLDNQSEHEVQQALEVLLKGRTAIIVAHRLSTIKKVDQVIVIEAGEIVEVGTQGELLKNQGTFSKLHALQFNA